LDEPLANTDNQIESGTGVSPVDHAQDAPATIKNRVAPVDHPQDAPATSKNRVAPVDHPQDAPATIKNHVAPVDHPQDAPATQIRIRLAAREDIPALQRLIDASVRALSLPYYDQRQIESALRNVFGVDSQLIQDETYFVAEIEGQVVAGGGWSKRKTLFGGDQAKPDQLDELLNPATDAARIRAFYVHPTWSRRGIGRQIAQACEEAAKNAGFTTLELIATLPGEPLYSAVGYRIVEPFAIPLPDGQSLPAFRMEKSLR
jgi:predicted N-acetyltransferase YhbS